MTKPDGVQPGGPSGVRREPGARASHPTGRPLGRPLGWAPVGGSQQVRIRQGNVVRFPPDLDAKGEGVNPYVPILVLGAIAAGFAVLSITAGSLSGPKRYNRAKLDAYECGIEPTPHAPGGGRFPIKYYLVAMLFIVFDIESVFLIPYAVAFDQLKLFGLVEMVLFIVTVFVAYAYVWRRGGLEWE
jgi:NADH-quinone oxidoreductase subunit A